ncbi:hypothetical protein E2P81_ATG09221 [Venturia nashicola]|uniref:Uncharacterized protein n=1 Tax=Venturia nashicola TaxID=86259 RepID=A0A4Z1NNP9_9PEZI|nr:hypothetical protein E6O75_ATG09422 [Venturia nashicola]TLD20151.1 hypothetical protein E2P81_ATG09221 [Venturia nashicola]
MCWHSAHDTLTNISIKTLNSLYSSLSSSKPSASSYMFDPLALIAATATTSASTRSTSRYSVFAETTSTASNTSSVSTASHTVFVSTSSESSSLSGGAIAGIVIGILVAFAFLAGGFYMIARRRRQKNVVVQEAAYEADAKEVQELSGEERSELPAAKPPALELEGSFPEGPKIPGTDSEEMHALSHGRDE